MSRKEIKRLIKNGLLAEEFKEKVFAGDFHNYSISDLIFAANQLKLDFYDTMQIIMIKTK